MTSKGQQTMENLEVVFRFRFPFAGRLAVVVCFERHVLPSFRFCAFINFFKAGWPSVLHIQMHVW